MPLPYGGGSIINLNKQLMTKDPLCKLSEHTRACRRHKVESSLSASAANSVLLEFSRPIIVSSSLQIKTD